MFRVNATRPISMYDDDKIIKCNSPIEMRSYELLGHHPNFLKYYGSKNNCIILEYLPNFNDFESMFGTTPDNFLEIVTQSFSALDYLHYKGLYHGDLGNGKNIVWDLNLNRVVLIDLEGGEIGNKTEELWWDNRDLCLLLWLILDGDIPQEMYEVLNDSDYESFIDYINERRERYDDMDIQRAIDIIVSRLK